jgi:hypothetical protein
VSATRTQTGSFDLLPYMFAYLGVGVSRSLLSSEVTGHPGLVGMG